MTNRARRRKSRKPKQSKASETKKFVGGLPVLALILGGLLLVGAIMRLSYLDRSLWLDEAWVANSVQSPTLHEAFYYDDWLQTTPPLFVVMSRVITALFGTSNMAFRIFPAVAGIISVLLFGFIAFRLLKPNYAMIATLLFVFNPRLILYGQSLKQYSTDVLSTVIFIVAGYMYMTKRTDRAFYVLLASFVALSFLSYQMIVFFPFLLYAAVIGFDLRRGAGVDRGTIRLVSLRLGLVVVCVSLVGAINYWFFIRPNNSPALVGFFLEGFYRGHGVGEFLKFYGLKFLTLPGMLFFGGRGPLPFIAAVVTVIGFIYPWISRTILQDSPNCGVAMLLALPVLGSVALNVLGMFPLPRFDHRLLVFVFPTIVLAFALGLQCFVRFVCCFIASRIKSFKPVTGESVAGAIVFVGMAALGLLIFSKVGLRPYFAEEYEDSDEAVAYLAQRVQSNDVLYVHSSMREQFRLYSQRTPVTAGKIIYGKIGMPCCPRKDYRSPSEESAMDIADEVSALGEALDGGSLWLLITDRPLHWVEMRRNDIAIFERLLARQSCEKTDQARLMGVYVARFGCKPNSEEGTSQSQG
jgi:4-amino-4-deoxy-L-arabinose transferase-like glycosyltransferase